MSELSKNIHNKIQSSWKTLLSNANIEFFCLQKILLNYTKSKFKADINSALNVSLLAFPQTMAYALIAGLPIQYGIYGGIVASIAATLFSKSPFLSIGPTNATAILLMSTFSSMAIPMEDRTVILPLTLILLGVFLVLGAIFNIANLIQFISRSVVTGYITAAAMLIIANQIPSILGYTFPEEASTFYDLIKYTLIYIKSTHWPSVLASGITVWVYFLTKKYLPIIPNVASTLMIMSGIGILFSFFNWPLTYLQPFDITLWNFNMPEISFSAISHVSGAAFALSILCLLESSSIGKSLAARAGQHYYTNQEMMNLGFTNICCGFLSGLPASGSLTRSTLSYNTGSKTTLTSFYNGTISLIIALAVGNYINYVPQASLAVIVIIIGISLINPRAIEVVTKTTTRDAVVFATTFISGLLIPLDNAIIFGVGLSLILFLRRAAIPQMIEYAFTSEGQLTELEQHEKRPDPEISIVHVEGNLFFGAAELFQEQLRRVCEEPNLKVLILKTRNAYHMDATSLLALEELAQYMKLHHRTLLITEARKDVIKMLKKAELLDTICRENIFPDVPKNPTLSTARALKYAQEIIGSDKAHVSIYFEPNRTPDSSSIKD